MGGSEALLTLTLELVAASWKGLVLTPSPTPVQTYFCSAILACPSISMFLVPSFCSWRRLGLELTRVA